MCPINFTTVGDVVHINCTVPEIEAAVLPVRVQVLPLGFGAFDQDSFSTFTSRPSAARP